MQDVNGTNTTASIAQSDSDLSTKSPSATSVENRPTDQTNYSTETGITLPAGPKREPGSESGALQNSCVSHQTGDPNGSTEAADRTESKDDKMTPQLVAAKAEAASSPQPPCVPGAFVGKLDTHMKGNEKVS